jgi:hypothetical protein
VFPSSDDRRGALLLSLSSSADDRKRLLVGREFCEVVAAVAVDAADAAGGVIEKPATALISKADRIRRRVFLFVFVVVFMFMVMVVL